MKQFLFLLLALHCCSRVEDVEVMYKCSGKTLFQASARGDVSVVNELLASGVNPNFVDSYLGWTPLCTASRNNKEDVVRRLLQVPEIDVDLSRQDMTPLVMAVRSGYLSIVNLLLKKGASVKKGALIYEAVNSSKYSEKILDALLDTGADPNAISTSGATALYVAAKGAAVELVRKLLKRGAKPNIYGDILKVPLYWAASKKRPPLLYVVDVAQKLHTITKLLLECNATFNESDEQGEFPLHKASQCNDYSAALALSAIADGSQCDIDMVDKEGKTALYYAGEQLNIEGFVYLVSKGASFQKASDLGMDITKINKSGGRALIHLLADKGHFDTIIALGLTPKQINVPTRDNKKTVLHYAVARTVYSLLPEPEIVDPDLFDRLITAGCKLNIREKSKAGKLGPLPIEVALRGRHLEMFKYLYRKMQKDQVSQSLLRNKNVKAEIKAKGSKEIKAFVAEEEKKAAEKIAANKQEEDDSDEDDKAIVETIAVEKTSKKRKQEEDEDEEDDDKTKVKKVKIEQTSQQAKGKKRKGGKK